MAYVDVEYYKITYKGTVISDEDLEKQLERASDQIDSMTYNRIVGKGFNILSEFQQTRVKKAVCTQAEYMYQYGDYLNMPVSGYSAGSTSVSFKDFEIHGIKTTPEVIQLLSATGLTSRRIF